MDSVAAGGKPAYISAVLFFSVFFHLWDLSIAWLEARFLIGYFFLPIFSALLDDLDKELNNYIMRCREWYGWHFPELGSIVQDHVAYVKTVKKLGMRTASITMDLSDILPTDLEQRVKDAAHISMGTEISQEDVSHINGLCDQVWCCWRNFPYRKEKA